MLVTTMMMKKPEEKLQPLETVEITTGNGRPSYYLSLTQGGAYWLESENGPGMRIEAKKIYDLIDWFFGRE